MRAAPLIRRATTGALAVGLATAALQLGGSAAQGMPGGPRLGGSQTTVTCPLTSPNSSSARASRPPVATGSGVPLQVVVPPMVYITIVRETLLVSTNTDRPPARTDEFYLIRRGRAGPAPTRVVERVLRSCR